MKPKDESKNDPLWHLGLAMGDGRPGRFIEEQEEAGQSQLVHGESLPTDCRGDSRAALEAAGVVFGDPYSEDPMFCPATLPSGWSKRRTEHSMWSELIDERGRKRASIFYKAAFYDRSAHMGATRRFSVTKDYDRSTEAETVVVVLDCGDVVQEFKGPCPDGSVVADEALRVQAYDWLRENRPNWEDASAYWEDEN